MEAVIVRILSLLLDPSEMSVKVPLRLIMVLTIIMMMTIKRIMMRMMMMTIMMTTTSTTTAKRLLMTIRTAMKVFSGDYNNVFSSVFHGCSDK